MVRVYSVYLSTLTGTQTAAVINASINSSFQLVVVTTVAGALAVGQYITIGGKVTTILSNDAVNVNNWNLTNPPTATALAQVYTTYTYTPSPSKYLPISRSNIASVTWAVNWREIFGNRTGECRCRVRLISNSTNNLTWANNVGSIRATFAGNTSNNTNGVNIGFVRPQSDFIATQSYLDCDTTTSDGMTIIIPSSNNTLTVMLLNAFEQPMSNVPDYQIWLYFETDDEDPYDKKDLNQGSTTNIFRPV